VIPEPGSPPQGGLRPDKAITVFPRVKGLRYVNRQFGQYIIGKRNLSKEQIIDAVRFQRAIGKKFSQLAVSRKYINEMDAEKITKKMRVVDKKFGEIAQSEGLMTERQIQEVMDIQLIEHISLEAALLDLGLINETEMLEELRYFREEQQELILKSVKIPEQVELDAPVENSIVTVMGDVFSRLIMNMANIYIKLDEVKVETMYTINPYYCVVIKVSGTIKGKFLLKMTRAIAHVLVSSMMGLPVNEMDDVLIADTVGEFLNIVMGHIHTRLRQDGKYFTISPPLVYHHSQEEVIRFNRNERSIILPFFSPEGLAEMHWIEEA